MNKHDEVNLAARRTLRSKLSIAMSKTEAHRGTGFNREAVLDAITPVLERELRALAEIEAASEGDGYYGAGAHAVVSAFAQAIAAPTRPFKGKRKNPVSDTVSAP